MTSSLDILATHGELVRAPRVRNGVYLLVRDERVVYVGQSRNILRRVQSHTLYMRFDYFIAIPARGSRRLSVERSLIRAFLPEFNTKIPAADPNEGRILRELGLDPAAVDRKAADLRRAPELAQRSAATKRLWQTNSFLLRRRKVAA